MSLCNRKNIIALDTGGFKRPVIVNGTYNVDSNKLVNANLRLVRTMLVEYSVYIHTMVNRYITITKPF